MSNRNWTKHKRRERMSRNGTEERDTGASLPPVAGSRRAPPMSKEELRREADRLLAGYTGPVTRLPAGSSGNPSTQPFAGRPQMRQKHKGRRPHGDLLGPVPDDVPNPTHIGCDVPRGLVIYCDGACEPNPGKGGWAFVVYRDGKEVHFECGGEIVATNNIMEITGVIKALEWLLTAEGRGFARIFSDSRYVVKGCNEWRHGWKRNGWNKRKPNSPKRDQGEIKNLDLWKELDAALTAVPITLEWVKGHVGILGNERADELSLVGRESVLELRHDPAALIKEQLTYVV